MLEHAAGERGSQVTEPGFFSVACPLGAADSPTHVRPMIYTVSGR